MWKWFRKQWRDHRFAILGNFVGFGVGFGLFGFRGYFGVLGGAAAWSVGAAIGGFFDSRRLSKSAEPKDDGNWPERTTMEMSPTKGGSTMNASSIRHPTRQRRGESPTNKGFAASAFERAFVGLIVAILWAGATFGLSYAAVSLYGGGPRGPQGPQGEKGLTGPQGPRSENASAPTGLFGQGAKTPCQNAAEAYVNALSRPGISDAQLEGLLGIFRASCKQ